MEPWSLECGGIGFILWDGGVRVRKSMQPWMRRGDIYFSIDVCT